MSASQPLPAEPVVQTPALAPPVDSPTAPPALEVRDLGAFFGSRQVVAGVDLTFPERSVTALIGPSGCGKSTFLRCLNRMHELIPGAKASGEVLLHGMDLYERGTDPVAIRRRVGMVFQRPNPFPTKSIADNVLAGARFNRVKLTRAGRADLVERTLRGAGLWGEVKDRLQEPAAALSGGQQQRLCIARALAVEPEVLLMDEPCSALDPGSTRRIEDLIATLRERLAIVIVTHNMQQARRVSDRTAFFTIETEGEPGRMVEVGLTTEMFTRPTQQSTLDYVTGRFG